jgi:hypothetical protein
MFMWSIFCPLALFIFIFFANFGCSWSGCSALIFNLVCLGIMIFNFYILIKYIGDYEYRVPTRLKWTYFFFWVMAIMSFFFIGS